MKPLSPKLLLHLEGASVLVGACLLYRDLRGTWLSFALLFLAPDLFKLGYLVGNTAGARIYNLGHTYLAPVALCLTAYYFNAPALYPIGVIWIAHIGFDRMIGSGLKYPSAFKDTHMSRV